MKQKSFRSIHEIRLARERLRFECLFYGEKLKNSRNRLFSGFTHSIRDIGFNIRNRLFALSLVRSVAKSNMFYEFIANFAEGFRKARK